MISRSLLAGLALLALLAPVSAQACVPTTTTPDLTVGAAGTVHYIDNDPCQPNCLFAVWIYSETNGIAGLQRDDALRDDTCGGQIAGDTLTI